MNKAEHTLLVKRLLRLTLSNALKEGYRTATEEIQGDVEKMEAKGKELVAEGTEAKREWDKYLEEVKDQLDELDLDQQGR